MCSEVAMVTRNDNQLKNYNNMVNKNIEVYSQR